MKNTRIKSKAANAAAMLALHAEPAPIGIELARRIVLKGYIPTPEELTLAIEAGEQMRLWLHEMPDDVKFPNKRPEHQLVSLDDQLWYLARKVGLSPEARAVIRAAGHCTPAPACGQPMPAVWLD